jgi:hypothetical protein
MVKIWRILTKMKQLIHTVKLLCTYTISFQEDFLTENRSESLKNR